ncbi:peptidoglycan DD-metalloendopeptidase family protein [Pseudorhodobacter wandonensis]|jgi:murein DD-endopeptidase MepM/ murein hydrolase activator NlpD|uniref:peptidoglycan DD-metalloendopeptidase family protein n=1 Tax=Pseudorhodobacter wandonensis TaxID=1120568 RepID=UPI00067C69E7|nr:peptidoglycan DD-metalloendopeptidase family protein [Pseudorhodobacter wandonensis]
MPDYPKIAARLSGQPDLYSALLAAEGPLELGKLLAACDSAVAARLASVDQGLLRAILRAGAGDEAVAGAGRITEYLKTANPAPVFLPEINAGPSISLPTDGQRPDMPVFSDRAFDAWFAAQDVPYGLGLYGENRTCYASAQFADQASDERRTVHLGVDVFAPAGTPVHAPFAGKVRYLTYNSDPLDYGHTLILEHDGPVPFFTLYGHLGASLPTLLAVGDAVTPGQIIAHLGDWHENGGWAPHLHFQIMTSMLEQVQGNFFGVGHAGLWDVWSQICPDPNLILRIDPARFAV